MISMNVAPISMAIVIFGLGIVFMTFKLIYTKSNQLIRIISVGNKVFIYKKEILSMKKSVNAHLMSSRTEDEIRVGMVIKVSEVVMESRIELLEAKCWNGP
jgi:hypothetical protein